MEEENGRVGQFEKSRQLDSYTNVAKGKRRTYFFDFKSIKEDEAYVIITESKRFKDHAGQIFYEKHKIYVYTEDLENFILMLTQFSNSLKNKKSYTYLIKKGDRIKTSAEEFEPEAQMDYNYFLGNDSENPDTK